MSQLKIKTVEVMDRWRRGREKRGRRGRRKEVPGGRAGGDVSNGRDWGFLIGAYRAVL